MANVRTRGTDKVKVVSAVITLAVIVALVFGILSQNKRLPAWRSENCECDPGEPADCAL